jgi:Fe-S-cluster containining protein
MGKDSGGILRFPLNLLTKRGCRNITKMYHFNSGQHVIESLSLKTHHIYCLRCGICCTRHQAITSLKESRRIAYYLKITECEWVEEYSDPRWRSDKNRLIRHINGKCVFLKYDGDISYCVIQPVKPSCCRNWTPSLNQKECLEGFSRCRVVTKSTGGN